MIWKVISPLMTLLLLFVAACIPRPEADTAVVVTRPTKAPELPTSTPTTPVIKASATPFLPTITPSPVLSPTATRVFARPVDNVVEVELGELFYLEDYQAVSIPTENLYISYTVEIDWECPDDAECEVPLLTTTIFREYEQQGDDEYEYILLTYPDTDIGDYVIHIEDQYSGYDYWEHKFWILATVNHES